MISLKKNRPVIIFVTLVMLVVALALLAGYFYRKYHRLSLDPAGASQTETKALIAEVGRLMVLPENEAPTIATVSDPEALKGQEFFAEAKKGDKVLIYAKARKAILYDPGIKKIITIAPVNTGTGQ